jgi:WD40 repeat protein
MKSHFLSTLAFVTLTATCSAADGPKLVHSIRTDPLVKWIAITPDGKTLVAAGEMVDIGAKDGYEVNAWDLGSGKLIAGPVRTKTGTAACGTISPDGKLLLTGGTNGQWHLWDLPDLKAVADGVAGIGRVHRVAFAPDGKTFSTLHASYRKRLTDPIRESRVTYSVRTFDTATREPVGAVAPWPREHLAGESAILPRIHEPAEWTQYGRPKFGKDGRPIPPDDTSCVTLALPDEPASCGGPMVAEIDRDHKRALSAGCNGSVVIWDYPARKVVGKPLATFHGLSVTEGGMIISPDGRLAAIVGRPMEADDRPAVIVFNLDKRSVVAGPFRPAPVAEPLVDGLAFTPDGTTLAVAGRQRDAKTEKLYGLIEVWTLGSGK